MRWIHGLSGVVLFTALQACTKAPEAPAPRSFTATLVTVSQGKEDKSQLVVRGDVLRVGQPNEADGDLYDLGAGKKWILRAKQKLAVERTIKRSQVVFSLLLPDASGSPCTQNPNIVCTREGEEMVGGRRLVKWRLDLAGEKKPQGDHPATAWVDPALGATVRFTAEKDGLSVELRDIKAGPVEGALVQVPSDFTRVTENTQRPANEPGAAPR